MKIGMLFAVVLFSVHAQTPTFEVASLKPVALTPGNYQANLGTARRGEVNLSNVTLSDCLRFAYGITNDAQIVGAEWIRNKDVRFDIIGKAAPDTPVDQLLLMLQNLLLERFQMKLHREKRELSVLALMPGKKAASIQEAVEGVNNSGSYIGPGRIETKRISMQVLATLLSRYLRQAVLDMTEMKGFYAVKLEWAPDQPAGAEPDTGKPSIYTAVQEQLGLKLETRKGPLEVIVIDHVERAPVAN